MGNLRRLDGYNCPACLGTGKKGHAYYQERNYRCRKVDSLRLKYRVPPPPKPGAEAKASLQLKEGAPVRPPKATGACTVGRKLYRAKVGLWERPEEDGANAPSQRHDGSSTSRDFERADRRIHN